MIVGKDSIKNLIKLANPAMNLVLLAQLELIMIVKLVKLLNFNKVLSV